MDVLRSRRDAPTTPDYGNPDGATGAVSLVDDAVRHHFLDEHSLEITARERDGLADVAPLLKPGTTVAIAFLPTETNEDRVEAAITVRGLGLEPMPHLSARRLTSERQLETLAQRLTGEAGVRKVFLIAGDPSSPAGPFADTVSMLRTGLFERHGITSVGIAGHPEGHPVMDEAELWLAMDEKISEIRERGMKPSLVTQFSFDADAVLAWLEHLRQRGFDLPVRVGIPGPAGIKRLLRYATMCGVGSSASVLKKYGISLTKLIGPAGPDRLVDQLRAAIHPELGNVAAHMHPFGGLLPTIEWATGYRTKTR